jgi:tetratricopeptide (TPR) repeat protein
LEAQRGQHLKAIKLYYRSMPNRYAIWDRQGEAYSYVYSGDSYLELGEHEKAISEYGLALVLAKQTKDMELQAMILDRMVSPYLDKIGAQLLSGGRYLSRAHGDRQSPG